MNSDDGSSPRPSHSHLTIAFVGKRDSVREFGLIVGVSIALVALIAVIILMVIVYWRKSTDECSKKQPSDCDTLEYTRSGEVLSSLQTDHHPPLVPSGRCKFYKPVTQSIHWSDSLSSHVIAVNTSFVKTTPIFTHYSASPSYIESHHYEEPNQIMPLSTLKQTPCVSYASGLYSGTSRGPCDFSIHDISSYYTNSRTGRKTEL